MTEAHWQSFGLKDTSYEAILHRLHSEASQIIPGLSPDPKQADPVVVLLLKAFAREYTELYQRLDNCVDLAYQKLVQSLLAFPRGPEPASTVLQVRAKDPGTKIPLDLQAFTPQPVQLGGGRRSPAYFSPMRDASATSGLEVAALVLIDQSGQAVRLPDPYFGAPSDRWNAPSRPAPALFLALDGPAQSLPEDQAEMFIYGDPTGVRLCLWSPWISFSSPYADSRGGDGGPRFIPGEVFHELLPFEPPPFTFRSDTRRLASPYEPQFVTTRAPQVFTRDKAVPEELGNPGTCLPPMKGTRGWVKINLAREVDLAAVLGVRARTNAFLVANREIRTSGAVSVSEAPVHSWIFPEDVSLDNLLRIEQIWELGTGHEYTALDSSAGIDALRSYRLIETPAGECPRLKIEMTCRDPRRKRNEIQIDYSVTLGEAANGLEPGSVKSLYAPATTFPGIVSVSNLVPTMGGRPASSRLLQVEELRDVLRHHGRAITAMDYVQMCRALDPSRVADVRISRGVVRGRTGLKSSILVDVGAIAGSFVNEVEREYFRRKLNSHLQDRSPLGEVVEVRLAEVPAR